VPDARPESRAMATPVRQPFDRATDEARVLNIARGLVRELGSYHAADSVRGSAHLDRDLGLGSLERVELVVRLDREFGAHLPDRVVAEANTLDDLIAALSAMSAISGAASVESSDIAFARPAEEQLRERESDAAALASAETWQDVLRYRARCGGERAHLILWEDDEKAEHFSFKELHDGAQAVADELARRGITRGDAVALMLPTCRDFFLTFAGVWLVGAVPVPIYPPARADRIEEYAERQSAILRNANARLLVTFREASRVAQLLRPSVPSLAGVVTAAALMTAAATPPAAVRIVPTQSTSNEVALLQYTSGSTGDPKGVILTHANLLANVRTIGEALSVQPDDVGVSWLPLYHDMGLIGAWLMPLYFGLPVVVMSPLAFLTRPERWLRACHRYRGTLTAAPNFAYELAVRRVADADLENLDLSSLRAALNGAEPVNPETIERFAARFAPCGLRREALTPVYGLAEASLAVTIPPLGRGPLVDRVERDTFTRDGHAVPVAPDAANHSNGSSSLSFVSVGRAVPGYEVRLVTSAGTDASERDEGALWFRGPSATSGYFSNAKATQALFPEGPEAGWIDSGDRAYRVGEEFFITGRIKDIVFKAGQNIYPQEVEEIASRVAGVRKGCVVAFGTADAASGTERLIIVAETKERGKTARQKIAAAVVESVAVGIGAPPDAVEMLPPHSIPKTSSGKLRRDQTRQLYLAGKLGEGTRPLWLQVTRLAIAGGARTVGPLLRGALEKLYGVYAALVFLPWLPLAWLALLLAPGRRAAASVTSFSVRIYLFLIGCRVRVEGRELMTTPGPKVLVSNHTSYFDVLVLMGALGVEYHFVAKKEVHDMPFIGTFLRKLGHFSFDRSDPQARARQAAEMQEALRRGESVFVFPEGTFTRQPGVRSFQLGAFKAAVAAGCQILPVALRGTRRFLREGSILPRPTSVRITIGPALEARSGVADQWREIVRLRDTTREIIARESGEPLL